MLQFFKKLFSPPAKEEFSPDMASAMFLLQIFDKHFGLTEEKRIEIESSLPEQIQTLAMNWILFYLAWLYKLKLQIEQGVEFSNRTIDHLHETLVKMGEKDDTYSSTNTYLAFCFEQMELALELHSSNPDTPLELFISQNLLTFDTNSPEYGKVDLNENVKSLAMALLEARATCVNHIDFISKKENLGMS